MKWILILTLTAYKGGVAVDHIPGFQSLDSCLRAAKVWLDHQNKTNVNYASFRAVCVQQ